MCVCVCVCVCVCGFPDPDEQERRQQEKKIHNQERARGLDETRGKQKGRLAETHGRRGSAAENLAGGPVDEVGTAAPPPVLTFN